LIDSNIIIFLSKGQIEIDDILSNYDKILVSIISYMEIYGYSFKNKREKALVDAFFNLVEVIGINKSIANIVIDYRKTANKKIKLPDAIILASAKYMSADLLTDDWDDFVDVDNDVNVLKLR